ncbi:acyl-CoA dehydrogenase family protein [Rhodococcoides yunnanense]|uniref:Acyl-CoA dehydrogenase family protein n=1 Tax=Rhodococcoides yunnanense TaxID=278209 RepID=A0ABU4BKJ6_9NOCA|nr:acyl-CoA dehydrogenase family protein [Rhodococcus yunnanensis]MDV6264737.1 acyl-CoA dehydrogenase family protein [Rhodococcus yunnanensis]
MDNETRTLLASSLKEMFQGGSIDIEASLATLGWDDVIDSYPDAAELLFAEHGRALAHSRSLDTVILHELADVLPAPQGTRAVVYPLPSPSDGLTSTTEHIDGVVLTALTGLAELVVPVSTENGTGVVVVAVADIEFEPIGSIESESSWVRVQGSKVPAVTTDATADWDRAVSAGRRALAAEIIGACGAALQLAIEHTSSRTQFGQPISRFQAVRHRLSETHVAIAAAQGMLDATWTNLDAETATCAKALAGRAQAITTRTVLQVCGAVGISAEHPMHRFVERAAVLDALLTPHLILVEQLGSSVLAGDPIAHLIDIGAE